MSDIPTAVSQTPRKVVIVDDTRTIRALLRATIDADPRLTVVGEAADPFEAREMIKRTSPDVITLDVEMPRMNGLDFLERLMRLRPMPVVMVSNRTKERSADAVRALSIGAIDCVDVARLQADDAQRARLTEALFCAASAIVRHRPAAGTGSPAPAVAVPEFRWNGRMVVIGSSTGGVEALDRVLSRFPANCPPTLIAQHMPEAFLRSFAQRLNDATRPNVRLAREGDLPAQGEVLIAPGGDHHMVLTGRNLDRVAFRPATGSELYVPSVDMLFASVIPAAPKILAVVLTGMGRDGSRDLQALSAGGAILLAQSGETCVVDGMPRAARATGAVDRNIALDSMGDEILAVCSNKRSASTLRQG